MADSTQPLGPTLVTQPFSPETVRVSRARARCWSPIDPGACAFELQEGGVVKVTGLLQRTKVKNKHLE